MTGSDNLMNHPAQWYNIMSPITTSIRTITRKSVYMVAELSKDTAPSWIPDTATGRLEDYSTAVKAATATAVALDTKALAAQGTVVQLKSELAQSQQSRTEAKTQADSLSLIALKPTSYFGADTVVGRIPGRLIGESLDRLGNPTVRMTLQTEEQPIRLDEDQLTTDTADLKMMEDAFAEDTAALESTTQGCLAIQAKVVDFEACNKSLSEELEALVKPKAVISEKIGDAEYLDNRSMLSSRGGLAIELTKSENSIGLAQLASRIDSAIHAEISNGDDLFAKVKGLISDMITRSEEKASADDTHNAIHKAFEAKHINIDMKIKWIDDSQGVPLEELRRIRQDRKENKLKSLIIVVIFHCNQFDIDEMIAVTSYKSPDYSGWNGWQSIVIETEYGDAQVDKADENSQRLETYDAMRKTTESEREAGDQIMEQVKSQVRSLRSSPWNRRLRTRC